MLVCHLSRTLKYVAELNYIFIIPNGPWCPITALQYIFNNPTCLSKPTYLTLQGKMSHR